MGKRKGMRKAYLHRFAADRIQPRSSRVNYADLQNKQENAEKHLHGEIIVFDKDGKRLYDLWDNSPNPRRVVEENLAFLKLMQSTRLQRVEEFNHVALIKTKKQELRLYFSGGDHFLMEIDHMSNKVRRSTVFKSKKHLLNAYSMKCLTWVETSPLVR